MSEDHRRDLGEAWTLGFTLVGLVLVFTGLGYLIDRWVGTMPWFMIGGVFVGAGLGFAYLATFLFSRSRRRRDGDGGGRRGRGPEAD
jgi:F0F1-type ATP synthase assembly protein I